MFRKLLIAIVLLVVAAVAATFLRPKVSRAALGITPADATACEATKLPLYPRPGYNRRVAANDFMPYAVAALNVYADKKNGVPRGFTLTRHSPEWVKVKSLDPKGGLALDIYHKSGANRLSVLTVFRGTETLDSADWLANFSWATAWLPIDTQYDQARAAYRTQVREPAYARAAGRKVSFVAAGHSLGGGLAQHVAYAFPCTGAVVFNSSFITNRFRLAEPYDASTIIHIFEDEDQLTKLRRLLFSDKETDTYRHYRQDAVRDDNDAQHSITRLAIGMARQVVRCQVKRETCPIAPGDMRVRTLYCGSGYGKTKPICTAGAS